MSKKNYKVEVMNDSKEECELNFKLIIIGDSGVGKSSLVSRAIANKFGTDYSPTIGFEFYTFYIKIEDTNIKLQIWDTCGQEVYRSLIKSFYRNSSLAILVYAINEENSFKDLNIWLNEIRTEGNPDVNIFLLGNKVDLVECRAIDKDQVENFMKANNVKFFLETSAKTGFNAENVFIEAGKLLYEQHQECNKISINKGDTKEEEDNIKIDSKNLKNKEEDIMDETKRNKHCC